MSETIQGKISAAEYVYRGDRQTSESLRGEMCSAVRRHDGKCVRGKNGSMLVSFAGKRTIIVGKLLRKNNPARTNSK
jgi:hypothetical protein